MKGRNAFFQWFISACFLFVTACSDTDNNMDTVANTPPIAAITGPADGAELLMGTEITFTGTGMDEEDGDLADNYLVWTSNIDGEIGTGRSVKTMDLSWGEHAITLTVTDQAGVENTDTIRIAITIASVDPDADYTNSLGMTFNLIPAGTFIIGSPETEGGRGEGDAGDDEYQVQVTSTKSFYMQTTEVTQGQWLAVVGSNPSYFSSCGIDCPVEQVSWEDVQAFIDELNTMGQGTYRLPTEAEWEYAARAGSTTAFANGDISYTDYYSCGYDANLDAIGWYCANSEVSYIGCDVWDYRSCAGTHPVAQKDANAWGLYDMHGNVGELSSDGFGQYWKSMELTDPMSVRGGGWGSWPGGCRSASRFPFFRSNNAVGVRLVRAPG